MKRQATMATAEPTKRFQVDHALCDVLHKMLTRHAEAMAYTESESPWDPNDIERRSTDELQRTIICDTLPQIDLVLQEEKTAQYDCLILEDKEEGVFRIWRNCIHENKLVLEDRRTATETVKQTVKQIEEVLVKESVVVDDREEFFEDLDTFLLPHYCWKELPSWATGCRVNLLQKKTNDT